MGGTCQVPAALFALSLSENDSRLRDDATYGPVLQF